MPLDGHSYLVAQGWTGKGTGLRHGAISRPLAIPQKKTLAGLGKDRDEAFPFWDHLFSAAAKSIQLKVASEDEDEDEAGIEPTSALAFERTSTGILSNRRPVTGTPATTSGSNTPDETDRQTPRSNLLSIAKREAAKRGLYARFFRGPTLGPDVLDDGGQDEAATKDVTASRAEVEVAQELPDPRVSENTSGKRRQTEDGDCDERRQRKKLKHKQRRETEAATKLASGGLESLEVSDRKAKKQRKHDLKAVEKKAAQHSEDSRRPDTKKDKKKGKSSRRTTVTQTEEQGENNIVTGILDKSQGSPKKLKEHRMSKDAAACDTGKSGRKKRRRKDEDEAC